MNATLNAALIDKVALALLNHSRVSVGKKPLASLGDCPSVSLMTHDAIERVDANTWRERAIVALEASGLVARSVPELKIESLGGNCPVQGDGTIDGVPFYFRAQGQRWSMGIGGDVVMAPEWKRSERWGENKFSAGWMSFNEAMAIIERCAVEYLAEKRDAHQ